MPSTWTSPPSATRQPPPLVSAPRVVCLIVPPFTASVLPPLLPSACALIPGGPGGCLSFVPPSPLCPRLSLPMWCSASCLLMVFGVCSGGRFFAQSQGPGRLHSLAFFCPRYLPSPTTCTCRHRPGCLSLPPPPLSLPPCRLDPIHAAEFCRA